MGERNYRSCGSLEDMECMGVVRNGLVLRVVEDVVGMNGMYGSYERCSGIGSCGRCGRYEWNIWELTALIALKFRKKRLSPSMSK